MKHGSQSESTDGPKVGWSCASLEWLKWLPWSPRPQLLDVAWCSAAVVVVVVEVELYVSWFNERSVVAVVFVVV